ncbi:MBL fold metallo-hydrolase [Streptomyces purpurascens]
MLITHAHNDHLGSAEYLRATYGTPVYLHEAEVPHARREFLHQVSVGTVLRNGWRPGVLPWVVHALRSGGTTHNPVTAPEPFPSAGALDLPGRPVPVHTPGHTDGHCAYHVPGTGVLISGDGQRAPHLADRGTAAAAGHVPPRAPACRASLDLLAELEGELLLPGHGPVHRGPVKGRLLRGPASAPFNLM